MKKEKTNRSKPVEKNDLTLPAAPTQPPQAGDDGLVHYGPTVTTPAGSPPPFVMAGVNCDLRTQREKDVFAMSFPTLYAIMLANDAYRRTLEAKIKISEHKPVAFSNGYLPDDTPFIVPEDVMKELTDLYKTSNGNRIAVIKQLRNYYFTHAGVLSKDGTLILSLVSAVRWARANIFYNKPS